MNDRLVTIVSNWRAEGSQRQEGFDWSSRKGNWIEAFPRDKKFISGLPTEIDRVAVREICESSRHSIR